jgi:hypothetical protein
MNGILDFYRMVIWKGFYRMVIWKGGKLNTEAAGVLLDFYEHVWYFNFEAFMQFSRKFKCFHFYEIIVSFNHIRQFFGISVYLIEILYESKESYFLVAFIC